MQTVQYGRNDYPMFDDRWALLAAETSLLAFDAGLVMWLRLGRIAKLDTHAALAEWQKLASEKVDSAMSLQADAVGGKLGTTQISVARATVDHYRQVVAANRLSLLG